MLVTAVVGSVLLAGVLRSGWLGEVGAVASRQLVCSHSLWYGVCDGTLPMCQRCLRSCMLGARHYQTGKGVIVSQGQGLELWKSTVRMSSLCGIPIEVQTALNNVRDGVARAFHKRSRADHNSGWCMH